MKDKGRPILAAFQFLSRFPVKAELDFSPELLRRSAKHYPLVGLAIGFTVWLAAFLSSQVLPSLPAAAVTLIVWVWLTGGLHLDGWMDSADALLSYRSREKMLEIMKDSRVGAMGVLACTLLLLLKVTLIASLIDSGALSAAAAMLTAPVWSRWFMTRAMQKWPVARAGEGLAAKFHGLGSKDTAQSAVFAILLTAASLGTVAIAAAFVPGLAPAFKNEIWLPLVMYFFAAPLAVWLFGTAAARKISSRLHGLTGDTYGALNEGLEAVLLILAVILVC
ncbi:adenosylcobinamide-GDP ribazoletransferase [Paenibacillus sp. DYY-L-2]|uniref:adenosylcobinamide-GDP ribazoletransferase n=1 Tax=Paenibacillus sp. DYY-L-2 TaxID=3447013 RepID=UPI003F4F64D9